MRPTIPADILSLGHARSAARRARNFGEADRLRQAIEAAGYRVVDRGGDFRLMPAHPPDVVDADGRVRYGWSGAVPSRLDEAPSFAATLVIVAEGGAGPLRRTLDGLRAHAPAGTQVVIVARPDAEPDAGPDADLAPDAQARPDADAGPDANAGLDDRPGAHAGPEAGLGAALTVDDLLAPIAGAPPEAVFLASRLRPAAARNAGARRAAGSMVAWLQAGAVISGDVVTPLIAALADDDVAVAGAVGLTATDIRRLAPAPAGDVDAIDGTLLAFRREEIADLGPLDERFFGDEQLDRWWSLTLRDGPDEPEEAEPTDGADTLLDVEAQAAAEATPYAPRRAVALTLPIDPTTAIALAPEPVDAAEAARRRKRDLYRLIDRFTGRPDLLRPTAPLPD